MRKWRIAARKRNSERRPKRRPAAPPTRQPPTPPTSPTQPRDPEEGRPMRAAGKGKERRSGTGLRDVRGKSEILATRDILSLKHGPKIRFLLYFCISDTFKHVFEWEGMNFLTLSLACTI